MDSNDPGRKAKQGVSKVKLAVGAASLFLFIVGLKRTFSIDETHDAGEMEGDFDERPPRSGRTGQPRS